MVTITAPGIQMSELDLSFYDFPQPKEETQNVLVTGFAAKGHNNYPYEFTNKNTDDDLIATFGTPTTEAERYFFNTCSEAIKREKTVLYATRLPYKNDAGTTYNGVKYSIKTLDELTGLTGYTGIIGDDLTAIAAADPTLSAEHYAKIANSEQITVNSEWLEKLRSNEVMPDSNDFIIIDKNQELLQKIPVDAEHMTDNDRYLIGLLPIVTTATNALYYQKMINAQLSDATTYEATRKLKCQVFNKLSNDIDSSMLVYPTSIEDLDPNDKDALTLSKYATGFFPSIYSRADGSFDRDRLKNIGVVIFKGWVDAESGNKIKYEPVEAFAGSLKSDDVDPVTGVSRFIDDIINTNSKTIEFYSNCFNDDKIDYESTALLDANELTSYAIGFTEIQAKDKNVDFNLILQSLDKIFEKNKDINEKQIDLVVDAGVSNIAQFNKIVNLKSGGESTPWCPEYNLLKYDETNGYSAVAEFDICTRVGDGSASVKKEQATDTWALVLKKYDQFCKTRGDCMFLADGLRPFCVKGQKKRVSKTNFNSTVSKTLTPFIKWMSGKIDTSYGTGNCDWYQITDPISEVNIWMPPSTKTMCSLLDNFNRKYFWTAPAGVNNGRMNPIDNPSKVIVKDIAFSPTVQEAGDIYTKCWNYATYYQDEGFVLEGQRTFQSRATAFDRVNVRRVFLYLERKVAFAAKYFLYEPHTSYTRQRFLDAITPFFEDCKIKGGIADYKLQCDEKNNTQDTIDRNELHVKVAIKPTKAIEFIEITFVCLRTGASWSEAGM